MNENRYIDAQTYELEKNSELRSVQGGEYASTRSERPPRDYFTDEIRRQLSGDFGEEEFFGGGLTIRATMDPVLQDEAAKALRAGLEKYDRNLAIYRGAIEKLDPAVLGDEASWREALGGTKASRDIDSWKPAVVLDLSDKSARIGIEGEDEDADGHFLSMKDLGRWRPVQENGRGGKKARKPADLLAVGDVIHIRAVTSDADGSFVRWSLRQIPRIQGGFMAMDTNTGRVLAMQGGFSYQHSVFNRATQAKRVSRAPVSSRLFTPAALDSGYTPAAIVVDAPIESATRRKGCGVRAMHRTSSTAQRRLRTGIERSRNLMTIRLAQEVGMDTLWPITLNGLAFTTDMGRSAGQLARGAEETTLYQHGRRLRDVCKWRRAGGANAGGPRARPLGQNDLSPR